MDLSPLQIKRIASLSLFYTASMFALMFARQLALTLAGVSVTLGA